MSLYVIGVGGSGAKCIEALVQLASTGLFSEPSIKVLFVDPDETNGNLERSLNTLSTYSRCHHTMSEGEQRQCPWMGTKIETLGLWSPFEGYSINKDLKAFFHYKTVKQFQPDLGSLFDVLYTARERDASLDVGFRGQPAIASAIMSQLDLDHLGTEPWVSLIREIEHDTGFGKRPSILLIGSSFGSTGASSLPTIARLITNKLIQWKIREHVKIGCLFMLPYFGFTTPPGVDSDGVYARSEQFLLKAEAALRYYCGHCQEIFDTAYLLGNQTLSSVDFCIGKANQRNAPHFLELYAALAAKHFLETSPTRKGTVVLIGRENLGCIGWNDIPERSQVQPALVNMTRFTYFWLTEIAPELAQARRDNFARFIRRAPWMRHFFKVRGESLPELNTANQQTMISNINDWCQAYLGWLYHVHRCEGEVIELFNTTPFANPEKPMRDALATLVRGDTSDVGQQAAMNPGRIKSRLTSKRVEPHNVGAVGLAKAVYQELSN